MRAKLHHDVEYLTDLADVMRDCYLDGVVKLSTLEDDDAVPFSQAWGILVAAKLESIAGRIKYFILNCMENEEELNEKSVTFDSWFKST